LLVVRHRICAQKRCERVEVVGSDAIAIPPGAIHQIENMGSVVLKFLCCCAPGYEHEYTVLVDE
jgi:mannose-6-phosphate isomerase-like protein (cupin superfamily)